MATKSLIQDSYNHTLRSLLTGVTSIQSVEEILKCDVIDENFEIAAGEKRAIDDYRKFKENGCINFDGSFYLTIENKNPNQTTPVLFGALTGSANHKS